MRKYFFCFALLLVGCTSNDDDGFIDTGTGPPTAAHVPEITGFALSPDTVTKMDGAGTIVVTAEISFRDTGLDIQTLWVRMPDDTTIEFAKSISTETGTFSEDLTMSTQSVGTFALEFWLVDQAGDSSDSVTAEFTVIGDVQVSDWTRRLTVPIPLVDVAWDGQVFIAVGGGFVDGSVVLTSVDGIDWVAREPATDRTLFAVAAFGSDIYAVGGSGVLLSTDHGETWTVKAQRDIHFLPLDVVANSSQVIVTGIDVGFLPHIMISEDRGETWQSTIISWGAMDLIYRDGLFVAPALTGVLSGGPLEPCVMVSADGKQWNEILVGEEIATLNAVVHDDSQFFVAGEDGTVFSSFDAFNWTALSTPLEDVDYSGGAWNGTQLILVGRAPSNQDGTYLPIGISSSDGGASWDSFGIDTSYESRGIASGNGRFVSVGVSVLSDEGLIYTSD